MNLMRKVIVFVFILFSIYTKGQNSIIGLVILNNEINSELAKKISGTQYAVMITSKEEVDQAINQKMYSDLFGLLGEYLTTSLKQKGFAFTEAQRNELTSKSQIGICDLFSIEFNPGKLYRTLGALGVYKKAYLQFSFCDGSQYKVMLSDISVDGYSYHPNRFAAAFKRIKKPTIEYSHANRLTIKKLPILASRQQIDSLLDKHENWVVGEYQSLGIDKSSLKYSIAIVHLEGKWYGLYTGGGNINDWDIGEVKAELTETKSDKIFICTWYGLGKTKIEGTSIIFDDENTFSLRNELLSDKYVRIK